MKNTSFYEKCYQLLKKIPHRKVTTYKAIAHALNTKAYRAVGQAMKHNQNSPMVPCHRVVCSDGKIGGYAHGVQKKIDLLKKEGIIVENARVNLNKYLYSFRL